MSVRGEVFEGGGTVRLKFSRGRPFAKEVDRILREGAPTQESLDQGLAAFDLIYESGKTICVSVGEITVLIDRAAIPTDPRLVTLLRVVLDEEKERRAGGTSRPVH